MRTRDRDQDWIEELGRRRLEALIAELTPTAGPRAAVDRADLDDNERDDEDRDFEDRDDVGVSREPADLSARPRARVPDVADEVTGGRHARRALSPGQRVRGWVSDRLPESAREQGLQQGHVGVLALLLAVAVLLGGWAWLRASGDPPAAASAPVVTAPATSGSGSPSLLTSPSPSGSPSGSQPGSQPGQAAGSAPAGAEVVVHVAGKVKRPGIVVLRNGSRVIDAIRRAGGFAPGTGPRSAALNLARVLVDGEQVVVGAAAQAAPAAPAVPGASAGATTGPAVSLNTADQAALETLPGVGPVTAAAILQWRDEHGPFTAVEQLLEVSGIGEATLAEIQPHVTL